LSKEPFFAHGQRGARLFPQQNSTKPEDEKSFDIKKKRTRVEERNLMYPIRINAALEWPKKKSASARREKETGKGKKAIQDLNRELHQRCEGSAKNGGSRNQGPGRH